MILVLFTLTTCTDHHHAHQVLGTHSDRPSGNSAEALWPRRSPVNEVTEGVSQVKTEDRGLLGVEQVEHHQGGGVFQASGPQPNKLSGNVRPTSGWV